MLHRRFGFNPYRRDVADEIHADLLRLAAGGKIRPVIGRRVAMDEAGRALDEHETRRAIGRTVGPVMAAAEYTWRDSELRSAPLRAFNAIWPPR